MLALHIAIAVSSMAFTTFLYFSPSKIKVRVSYSLVTLTLITGTYLVVSTGAPLLKACVTGLVYLGAVSAGIILAQRKLAMQNANLNRSDK
jgi:hypothetical protein